MKRVLIVGVSSLVGSNLAVALRRECQVVGTFHQTRPKLDGVPCFKFSLPYSRPLTDLVDLIRPDVLIYCLGPADFKRCQLDPMGTLYLHAEAPSILAEAMAQRHGQFFCFSTAKVFSGERGQYREEDPTEPHTVYGKAKLRGEELITRYPGAWVLRLGTVFGMGAPRTNSIFNRIFSQLSLGKPQTYVSDELRSFTHVGLINDAVRYLIHLGPKYQGLFHISHSERHSYFSFVKEIANAFDFSVNALEPISGSTFSAQLGSDEIRGKDISLDGHAFVRRFGVEMTGLKDSLEKMRAQLRAGAQ